MTRVFKQISTLSVHLNTFEHRKSRARAAKNKDLERVFKTLAQNRGRRQRRVLLPENLKVF